VAEHQTEIITWIPIVEKEPSEEGHFLITCGSEDNPDELEVRETLFLDGAWYLGADDEAEPIWGTSKDAGIIAWAEAPVGFKP
jgi:hypothetical protein